MRRFAAIAVFSTLAVSFAAPIQAQPASPRTACAADMAKLCPDAQPGNGSMRQCMMAHQADLSDGCKAAIAAAMAARRAAGATSGAPHN
jgi:Spy/CpxP family protein refolding chaperone